MAHNKSAAGIFLGAGKDGLMVFLRDDVVVSAE
jgi:hypothetical protein